jgi:hypothetical protein
MRALSLTAVLSLSAANVRLVRADTGLPPGGAAATDVRLRDGGSDMLVRYRADGSILQRYMGFGQIADIALYDSKTVLVAEKDRNTISAMTLGGKMIWAVPVHQPLCIRVLGPDRFLVCHDDPAGVLEVDRTGNVSWKVTSPLVDASGAVRLPDGNTAVVEGRENHGAVYVLNRQGEIVWTGPRLRVHPRGLGLLPAGELVTSGFQFGQVVVFKPYADRARSFGVAGAGAPTVTPDGGIITVAREQQLVTAWNMSGKPIWWFHTLYPPDRAQLLADGTILVSVFRAPDRQCLSAAVAARRAKRALAPYWRWLGTGVGSALLLAFLVQWPVLRARWKRRVPAPFRIESDDARAAAPLSRRRRLEIGLYVLAAAGMAAAAAVYHHRGLRSGILRLWPYAAAVGVAGFFLAMLQYRLPAAPNGWTSRMKRLSPMGAPTRRMWVLWVPGLMLLVAGLEGVLHRRGEWVLAPWSAGLALIAAGTIQEYTTPLRVRWPAVVTALLVVGVLSFLRLYRLQDHPRNLHHDMALWSVATFRLLEGESPTMLGHGYAEIPLLGHGWSALWTAIGGRSLAGTRLSSVAGSLVAIGAAFLITRRLYGSRSAVVAALLLGFNHGFLHFSRIQAYMDPVPFQVLSVLGLVAGFETGRYGWFALAGLAGGYSALTYHAGRITPLIIVLLGGLLLVRYPRAALRRWPGLLVSGVLLLGMIGPYAILYRTGRLNAFSRTIVFPFLQDGHVVPRLLLQTLARGLPRAIGAFWFYGDTSTQYGGEWSILTPACAALLGMAVVAALLRPQDIRGLWVVLWAFVVLVAGGALTADPPFWPRLLAAIVPGIIAVAAVAGWLCRGAEVAAGRVGRGAATAAVCLWVGLTSWQQLATYRDYCEGIRPGGKKPSRSTEWVQSIMGRDVQRWGSSAMIYVVARNPINDSCAHPTMRYYADAADLQDARDISQDLPFRDTRTIVCYFLPEMADSIAAVRRFYPRGEEKAFYNNLGRQVFTRLVIRSPHS